MSVVGRLHERLVYGRRVEVLASHISELLPPDASVLDVGCGDGKIDSLVMLKRPDVSISGIDVLVRDQTYIPVSRFDGKSIPYDAGSFDAVVLIDVLHHADSPEKLLQEARRISRGVIILKDHTRKGLLAGLTLRVMDWVGNAHHGVVLPYHYWTDRQWRETLAALNLSILKWDTRMGLYSWPAAWIFERSLHFIATMTFGDFPGIMSQKTSNKANLNKHVSDQSH